jgi:hypothetical protein
MTIDGFHKRHLKHTNDAQKGAGRDLYRKYPHQSLAAGLTNGRLGYWNEVNQRLGLGVAKVNQKALIELLKFMR